MLVSAVGGPAAKLSDFPAADAAIAWSLDGKPSSPDVIP